MPLARWTGTVEDMEGIAGLAANKPAREWTDADLDALQAGVSDEDTTTRAVRASHVVAQVTYDAVWKVELRRCTAGDCSSWVSLWTSVYTSTFGDDVLMATSLISAQTCNTASCRFWYVLTSQEGSVRVDYNGAAGGASDTYVAVPEASLLTLLLVAVPVVLARGRKVVTCRP